MRTQSRKAVAAKAGEKVQQAVGQSNPVQGARAIWLAQPGFRGESVFGDECSRDSNQSRRPVETTGDEKLNHERRESAWK